MPQSIKIPISFGVVLFVLSARYIGEAQEIHNTDTAVPAAQSFMLADTKDLVVEPGVKAEAVEYRGRKAVRLTRDAIDQSSMALINGTDFQDGTIEVDIATVKLELVVIVLLYVPGRKSAVSRPRGRRS